MARAAGLLVARDIASERWVRWCGTGLVGAAAALVAENPGVAHDAKVLNVLIASPGDVERQRDVIEQEVLDWNRSPLAQELGVMLQPRRWQLDAVPLLGAGDGQQVINAQLRDDADIVFGVFHSKLGTATTRAASGTAEELEGALDHGAFVHVYRDERPLSGEHDPAQLAQLNAYLRGLRPLGLLGSVSSDDDLARKVRLALDHDVSEFLREAAAEQLSSSSTALPALDPSIQWLDRFNAAVGAVLATETFASAAQFDGMPDWISSTYQRRHVEVVAAADAVALHVVEAVRRRDSELHRSWIEAMPALAPNPYVGGSTKLLNLKRAPGCLLFHAAGIAACAVNDYALAGRLLSSRVQVEDSAHGPRPAAVALRAELIFDTAWPSRDLREHLLSLLSPVLGAWAAGQAWERWTYLCAVATAFFSAQINGVWLEYPYLQVSGHHMAALDVIAGEVLRRAVDEHGDAHPLLRAGFCDGLSDLFTEAARTFESRYGEWADRLDRQALPRSGGAFPSAPHYPGERTT